MTAHDGLDGLGGLVGVVEGDGGDVVVKNVGLDDTVEEMTSDEAKLTVDGSSGTTSVGPGVGVVVGEGGVGVLQEGDHHKPVVDPEVGEDVPDEQVVEAVGLADDSESSDSKTDTEIREQDEVLVALLVQGAGGVEVVDTAKDAILLALALTLDLAVVVVVAGDVRDEVHGPSTELLDDGVEQGVDGGLFSQLGDLVDRLADTGSVYLACLGNEDHVALHVAGGLVVLAVGDLPREVWDEKGGVAEPADGVIDHLGG